MKSLSVNKPVSELDSALDQIVALEPTLILAFASPKFFNDEDAKTKFRSRLKRFPVIGTSTAGEISNQAVTNDSISLLGIQFENTKIKTFSAPLSFRESSKEAGIQLGEQLKADDLQAVILFGPGSNVNGSALIEGVMSQVGHHVIVTGGLAGDDHNFVKTYTIFNDEMRTTQAVAVGLYGNSLRIGCGSHGGWRPFGPARTVTKADENILYEIDGKPALQLYKQYLGDKAKDLPASGLLYPFAILREDRSVSGLIRTTLDVDHEKESLLMAGDIPLNSRICLMHADTNSLTQGAAQAVAEALRMHGTIDEVGCVIAVSCVGRKMIFGLDAEEEVEAVMDALLPNTQVAGYYSYGEISSYLNTGRVELYNQTMCITYISEKKDS